MARHTLGEEKLGEEKLGEEKLDDEDLEQDINSLLPELPFKTPIPSRKDKVSDEKIERVCEALKDTCNRNYKCWEPWSHAPRLYILLRLAGYNNNELTRAPFINGGTTLHPDLSDYYVPFTQNTLPSLLASGKGSRIRGLQGMVVSDSLSFDDWDDRGRHRHAKHVALTEDRWLGGGGQGDVHAVNLGHAHGGMFARKRIARNRLPEFIRELNVLRRVNHEHIVEFWGSYSDKTYFAFLFKPVAEETLETLLASGRSVLNLRPYHGCLAAGVAWLHFQGIRHMDIKPANILIDGGSSRVLICDFGSAHDSTTSHTSRTPGLVGEVTKQYLAPEATHGSAMDEKCDIWSLGAVYLEMITVDAGKPLSDLREFVCKSYKVKNTEAESTEVQSIGAARWSYCVDTERLYDWITNLKDSGGQERPAAWVRSMLDERPDNRPSADELLRTIRESRFENGPRLYIGPCCIRSTRQSIFPKHRDRTDVISLRSPPSTCGSVIPVSGQADGPVTIFRNLPLGDTPTLPPSTAGNSHASTPAPPIHWDAPPPVGSTANPLPAPPTADVSKPEHDVSPSMLPSLNPPQFVPDEPARSRRLVCKKPLARCDYISLSEASNPAGPRHSGIVEVLLYERIAECVLNSTRELIMRGFNAGGERQMIEHKFWMPFAEVETQYRGKQVDVSWSDCNHLRSRQENGTVYWYRVYDDERRNNTARLQFLSESDASEFVHRVHSPGEGPPEPPLLRCSERLHFNRLHVYQGLGPNLSRGIFDLEHSERSTKISKLYWLLPETDFRLTRAIDDENTVTGITFLGIGVPLYGSDTGRLMYAKKDRTLGSPSAHAETASEDVAFSFGSHSDCNHLLEELTERTLSLYLSVAGLKVKKTFWSKLCGKAELWIWAPPSGQGGGATIAIWSESKGSKPGRWFAATLPASIAKNISSGSPTATITVASLETCSAVLHTLIHGASRPRSSESETKKLLITFESAGDLRDFDRALANLGDSDRVPRTSLGSSGRVGVCPSTQSTGRLSLASLQRELTPMSNTT